MDRRRSNEERNRLKGERSKNKGKSKTKGEQKIKK
jgi:hypothetical protein